MSNPEISKELKLEVSARHTGLRLDKFLANQPDIGTRNKVAGWIAEGLVQKEGRALKASYRLQEGDIITVMIPRLESLSLQPFDFPLDVVYEDDACAVINKPAGLVVHPAAGHAKDTLVNALMARNTALSNPSSAPFRPGIVHRLDKDTSGLIVIAKNDRAHEALASQFKRREVHRVYWALVIGRPKQPHGTIESWLARHPTQRKKFSSQTQGKRAVTHYELLASSQGVSLLRCRLETGRTHQIRVHLSELGHPLIRDQIYSRRSSVLGKATAALVQDCLGIGLHACELGFIHPSSGEFTKFFATWPADWIPAIDKLGFADVSKPVP